MAQVLLLQSFQFFGVLGLGSDKGTVEEVDRRFDRDVGNAITAAVEIFSNTLFLLLGVTFVQVWKT